MPGQRRFLIGPQRLPGRWRLSVGSQQLARFLETPPQTQHAGCYEKLRIILCLVRPLQDRRTGSVSNMKQSIAFTSGSFSGYSAFGSFQQRLQVPYHLRKVADAESHGTGRLQGGDEGWPIRRRFPVSRWDRRLASPAPTEHGKRIVPRQLRIDWLHRHRLMRHYLTVRVGPSQPLGLGRYLAAKILTEQLR